MKRLYMPVLLVRVVVGWRIVGMRQVKQETT